MSTYEKLSNLINTYLEEENSGYAVMINGGWGSGKTYFWREYFWTKGASEAIKKREKEKIYISLYGVNDIAEIKNLIVLDLLHHKIPNDISMTNNLIRNFYKLLETLVPKILNKYSGGKLDSRLLENLLGFTKDIVIDSCTRNFVVCFDDLERTKLPVEVVLGYINNFVEHRNMKVIIICNEEEVEKKNCKYPRIKEKLVGYTFKFKPSVDELLDQLIGEHCKDSLDHVQDDHKSLIVELLKRSASINLRTVKRSLSITNFILRKDLLKIDDNKLTITEIIRFIFIVSEEIKSRKANPEDLRLWIEDDLPLKDEMLKAKSSEDPRFSQLEQPLDNEMTRPKVDVEQMFVGRFSDLLRENYGSWLSLGYHPKFKSIFYYIIDGYFDDALFNEEIKKLLDKGKSENIFIFSDPFDLSDKEFSDSCNRILNDVRLLNDVKNDQTIYLRTLTIVLEKFLYFSENKLIHESVDDIKDLFLQIIERQAEKNHLIDDLHAGSFDGSEKIKHYFPEYIDQVKKTQARLKQDSMKNSLKDSIDGLPNDPSSFFEILTGNKYKPLFHLLDVEMLSKNLCEMDNPSIRYLTHIIRHRYDFSNVQGHYADDYEGLKALEHKLVSSVPKEDRKLSHCLLSMLTQEIKGVLDRLKPDIQSET